MRGLAPPSAMNRSFGLTDAADLREPRVQYRRLKGHGSIPRSVRMLYGRRFDGRDCAPADGENGRRVTQPGKHASNVAADSDAMGRCLRPALEAWADRSGCDGKILPSAGFTAIISNAQGGAFVRAGLTMESWPMSRFDKQMERIEAIVGDAKDDTFDDALAKLFKHLKANLPLPCEVTGTEDFQWEEPYVIGGWSQKEYERLKKTQPSYTDKYELLDIEHGEWSEWMLFSEDIAAHVRRQSDGKESTLGFPNFERPTKTRRPSSLLTTMQCGW